MHLDGKIWEVFDQYPNRHSTFSFYYEIQASRQHLMEKLKLTSDLIEFQVFQNQIEGLLNLKLVL